MRPAPAHRRARAALALALAAPAVASPDAAPVDASPTLRSISRASVAAAAVEYQPPVAAAVADPFRPPSSPYGPGNRGLEYATAPGAPVRAAAAGTVTFAGQVGATRHVTVLHADRARTTYSGLAAVDVAEGQAVEGGAVVGTAAGPVLWTVRLGDAYLDPAIVLAASGQAAVQLVPVPEGLGGG